jgi:hypothetical protein
MPQVRPRGRATLRATSYLMACVDSSLQGRIRTNSVKSRLSGLLS